MNGSTVSRAIAIRPFGSAVFTKGGALEKRPPRGVEKSMLIFGGKVAERSPERKPLLGDRPATGLRQERSVRER